MAVHEAFRWGTSGTGLLEQNEVVERLNRWHELLLSDARFIAVVPFLWPTLDLNGDGHVDPGARELPWIKERVFQMAASLLHPEASRVFPVDYSASASYGTSVPFAATDRDEASTWNAGAGAPQWIAFDLGEVDVVKRIELLTNQVPAGDTMHVVEGAASEGAWFPLATFAGTTQDNQLLRWNGSASVRWVRVTTTQSPSWIAWREIRVFK
jgi:hypothetical protein